MVADWEIPRDVLEALQNWARQKPSVRRLFAYGSRVRGTHTNESDFDVAVEIDPADTDTDSGAAWICDTEEWQNELQPLLPWTVHLEWHDPGGKTPHVAAGLQETSLLVYEREDLEQGACRRPTQGPTEDG